MPLARVGKSWACEHFPRLFGSDTPYPFSIKTELRNVGTASWDTEGCKDNTVEVGTVLSINSIEQAVSDQKSPEGEGQSHNLLYLYSSTSMWANFTGPRKGPITL
jgi:hypothetical protein